MSGGREAARQPAAGADDLRRVLQAVLRGAGAGEPPVDWARLLPLARRHEVDAFLFDAVAGWPAGRRPPPEILADWRRLQLARAAAAVRDQRQRAELFAALKATGVSAIPLKGSWLAERVYADIVQRPMSDIDLLIVPGQAGTARQALEALGYLLVKENQPGDWGKEQLFRHPAWRCSVELQWQLWHPTHGLLPPQEMTRLWESAKTSIIAGVEVPVLSHAAHLVYLAYHIQAHQWRFPARAHLDIVLLGRRLARTFTQAELAGEARAWGMGFRACFVWRVAHDLCGVEPPPALAGWTPGDDDRMQTERRAALALALPEARQLMSMTRLLSEFQQASWWRRAALGVKAIAVPPAKIRQAYPLCTRRAGLAGGYAARLADLVKRRLRDVLPAGRRRAHRSGAAADMAARLRLDHWLEAREQQAAEAD